MNEKTTYNPVSLIVIGFIIGWIAALIVTRVAVWLLGVCYE